MLWLINLGLTDELVLYILAAVCALIVILTVAMFIFSCFTKFSPGSSMDGYIGLGSLGICVAVILRGVSTDWIDRTAAEVLCQMHPALLVVSWTLFLGGLMLKAAGVISHCVFFKDKKMSSGEWVPNLAMFLLTLVDAVGILIWIFFNEPGLTVMDAYTQSLVAMEITVNRTFYECDGPYLYAWTMGASIYHAVILGLTCILVWPALMLVRSGDQEIKKFTLSSILLAVTAVNALFAGAMGVLITYLMPLAPNVAYGVFGGLQLWTVLFAVILLLVAKILEFRNSGGRESKRESGKEHNYDMPIFPNTTNSTSDSRISSTQNVNEEVNGGFDY